MIIELKKGKTSIGRDEMNQADGYVQDFLGSGAMDGTPVFRAFVVGHEISPKTIREKDIREDGFIRGRILATTYSQLTRSANLGLFRLRERTDALRRGLRRGSDGESHADSHPSIVLISLFAGSIG